MLKLTPSTNTGGFTLVELLLAMSLLLILLGLAFTAFTGALQQQRNVEVTVSLESSLRRTVQILTQDLRNSAYGLLTNDPYPSENASISLARLNDVAVHSVTGPSTGFQASRAVTIIAPPAFSWPLGTRFLLINPTTAQKTATALTLSTAVTTGGAVTLAHATENNTVCYSPDNLVQRVNLVGYTFNATQRILYRNSQGSASPLAYGVSNFTLTYIDTADVSYTRLQDVPATSTLARVGVQITMQATEGNRLQSRSISSSVEIPKVFTLTNTPLKYVAPNTSVTC